MTFTFHYELIITISFCKWDISILIYISLWTNYNLIKQLLFLARTDNKFTFHYELIITI